MIACEVKITVYGEDGEQYVLPYPQLTVRNEQGVSDLVSIQFPEGSKRYVVSGKDLLDAVKRCSG